MDSRRLDSGLVERSEEGRNHWSHPARPCMLNARRRRSRHCSTPRRKKTVQNCSCHKFVKMSTKFDNFWHTDSTEDRVTWGALISTSPN